MFIFHYYDGARYFFKKEHDETVTQVYLDNPLTFFDILVSSMIYQGTSLFNARLINIGPNHLINLYNFNDLSLIISGPLCLQVI